MTHPIRGLGRLACGLALAAGCGGGTDTPTPTTASYQTTSNVGDFATWTFSGNDLSVVWEDIAPVTGDVQKTYAVSAICGSPNADFGYRTCLVNGNAVCTPGTSVCAAGDGPQDGDTFRVFEIPGVALAVSTNDDQLHAGFAATGCESVITDDYTFINIGLGQRDMLGLFRTDSSFSTIHHMDFGFSDSPQNEIAYNTGDPGGLASGITAGPCTDGVRELTVDQANDKVRIIVTPSGHLILDKPEGEGGMLAISAANAAQISDFASKEWDGITFPDDRPPEYVHVTTGALTNGHVPITSIVLSASGDITPQTTKYINDGATGTKLNEALLEPNQPYANNQIVIDGSYAGGPKDLPGVIELDPISGDETAIIGIGSTVNGRTMLFGAVVNEVDTTQNGVKGNFLLFER